jgi:5-methyltetrahydrofolate--homocysteine methyltransferase
MAELYDAILSGNIPGAQAAATTALEGGQPAGDILHQEIIPSMEEVGRRFEANEIFVPQLLLAEHTMKTAMKIIASALVDSGVEAAGRVVIGTVESDLHSIGKNLVCSMLEGCGFEVIDLGIDVKPEAFVEKAKEKEGTIVALSALLTTTMPNMKVVIDALVEAGIRDKTKVIVGGAPVNQAYADQIGADGYGENASAAIRAVRTLVAS